MMTDAHAFRLVIELFKRRDFVASSGGVDGKHVAKAACKPGPSLSPFGTP